MHDEKRKEIPGRPDTSEVCPESFFLFAFSIAKSLKKCQNSLFGILMFCILAMQPILNAFAFYYKVCP